MRLLVLLSLITAAACSSDPLPGTDASTPTDGAQADAKKDTNTNFDAGPTCAQTMMCVEEDKPMSGSPVCMLSLKATFVDLAGKPLAGETVYVCGTNICTLPKKTDAQGVFTADEPICNWFLVPALKYLGHDKFVSFANATPAGVQKVTYQNPVTLVALPQAGVTIPTSGPITSNGVTLTLAPNTTAKFDPSDPMDPEVHKFRAVEVPIAKAPPDIDASLKLEVLWGLAPFDAILTPAPKLTVPNTKAWAPNAEVELFLNSGNTYDLNPPVPYAKYSPIGTAHVSNDGMTITSDAGIPSIGIVGMRLKQ
jgi:hypothetical protein